MNPSPYEVDAWRRLQEPKLRPVSKAVKRAGLKAAQSSAGVGKRAAQYFESRPRAQSLVDRGQDAVDKGTRAFQTGIRNAKEVVPEGVTDWSGAVVQSVTRMLARASRVGLSPRRVVERHQKRGHEVSVLSDLRRLDLEEVDAVRGRGLNLYYPIAAAVSGAGAGLVVSGGSLVVVASAGAATAPSAAAVAGAISGDAAIVLGLASRSVGHVALLYGYDPEDPSEKLFVMSVVNAGTAASATAKHTAMADVSRLTQALVRGKAWTVLDKSIVTKVSKQFAKAYATRFTKQSLGKIVPAAGIVIGSGLNWATLESIVDAADLAYRRRFLMEKYPDLVPGTTVFPDLTENVDGDTDVSISVLDELAEAGGPRIG
nr:EcsC family protein [Arthrobacter koreensis]